MWIIVVYLINLNLFFNEFLILFEIDHYKFFLQLVYYNKHKIIDEIKYNTKTHVCLL